jgi:hypothetical protein
MFNTSAVLTSMVGFGDFAKINEISKQKIVMYKTSAVSMSMVGFRDSAILEISKTFKK